VILWSRVWWCARVDQAKFACRPGACGLAAYIFYLRARAPLAALRPYIYMYELVGLAVENRIDDPHAARRSIPPISLGASLVYIYQVDKEFA